MSVSTVKPSRYPSPLALERVKARLGLVDVDASRDRVLAELVDEVTGAVERELDRPLPRQGYREALVGRRLRRRVVDLGCFPVDPESVAVTIAGDAVAVQVAEPASGRIWRAEGWPEDSIDGDGEPTVEVRYTAGYVLPEALVDWAAGAAVLAGQFVRPTSRSGGGGRLFEVTTAGVLGTSEPEWPEDEAGQEVTDGGAVLVSRSAVVLPPGLAGVLMAAVVQAWSRRLRGDPALVSLSSDGQSAAWSRESADVAVLSPEIIAALFPWRFVG